MLSIYLSLTETIYYEAETLSTLKRDPSSLELYLLSRKSQLLLSITYVCTSHPFIPKFQCKSCNKHQKRNQYKSITNPIP